MPLTPRPPAFQEEPIAETGTDRTTEKVVEPQSYSLAVDRLLREQQMSLKEAYEMGTDTSEELLEET